DNKLPAPKMNFTQHITKHPCLKHTLHRIICAHENGVTHKCKDYCIGMHGAHATKCRVLIKKIHLGPYQLEGDQETDRHTNETPNNRRDSEVAYNFVVVIKLL